MSTRRQKGVSHSRGHQLPGISCPAGLSSLQGFQYALHIIKCKTFIYFWKDVQKASSSCVLTGFCLQIKDILMKHTGAQRGCMSGSTPVSFNLVSILLHACHLGTMPTQESHIELEMLKCDSEFQTCCLCSPFIQRSTVQQAVWVCCQTHLTGGEHPFQGLC